MPDDKTPDLTALARLTPVLEQARDLLANPTVQALRQRDAFHEAWETAVHDLLENMQEIRRDISAIRTAVNAACDGGENDTQKILTAIQESTREIVQAIWRANPASYPQAKARQQESKTYGERRKK